MAERGVSEEEVKEVLEIGGLSKTYAGRRAKVAVLDRGYLWRGTEYPNKEVEVVYVEEAGDSVVITVKARYGKWGE